MSITIAIATAIGQPHATPTEMVQITLLEALILPRIERPAARETARNVPAHSTRPRSDTTHNVTARNTQVRNGMALSVTMRVANPPCGRAEQQRLLLPTGSQSAL